MFNSVSIAGNLTRDPELRVTPNGKSVASFDIAINSFHKDKAGNKVEAVGGQRGRKAFPSGSRSANSSIPKK